MVENKEVSFTPLLCLCCFLLFLVYPSSHAASRLGKLYNLCHDFANRFFSYLLQNGVDGGAKKDYHDDTTMMMTTVCMCVDASLRYTDLAHRIKIKTKRNYITYEYNIMQNFKMYFCSSGNYKRTGFLVTLISNIGYFQVFHLKYHSCAICPLFLFLTVLRSSHHKTSNLLHSFRHKQ